MSALEFLESVLVEIDRYAHAGGLPLEGLEKVVSGVQAALADLRPVVKDVEVVGSEVVDFWGKPVSVESDNGQVQ